MKSNIFAKAAIVLGAIGTAGIMGPMNHLRADQGSAAHSQAPATDRAATAVLPHSRPEFRREVRPPYYYYRPHSFYGPFYRQFNPDAYYFWWNYGGNYQGTYHGYPYDALGFPW